MDDESLDLLWTETGFTTQLRSLLCYEESFEEARTLLDENIAARPPEVINPHLIPLMRFSTRVGNIRMMEYLHHHRHIGYNVILLSNIINTRRPHVVLVFLLERGIRFETMNDVDDQVERGRNLETLRQIIHDILLIPFDLSEAIREYLETQV